jgi:hypothetical protein
VAQQTDHPYLRPADRLGPPRAVPLPKVAVDDADGRLTVVVSGRVDPPTIAAVSGTIADLVADGIPELTVDLGGSWDGARLLSVLAETRQALTERGGTLHLVGVALPEFLAALRGAPLDEVFLVYDAVRRDPRRGVGRQSGRHRRTTGE